ncbi:hypothetical protein R1sor_018723 [Riccia sorocarpa]|uniref:Ubiquitin-like protease family profile domain-containing protein n=1 Tax=Riccia sorocarpa TaxID=122646 RepID=A0ABD3IB09_9MARC
MDPLTVDVWEEDIPVAAVQVIPTFVDDEVPLDENPVEVAPVPASDHGGDDGKILPEVADVLDRQEAVSVIGEAQEVTTSSLVDGWQDDGKFVQLVHDLTDTRNESQPVAEASTPNAVRNVEEEVATPDTAPNLEKVEFSVSEYLPIGSPAITHDAQESGEIRDNREMMRAMNNFVEAVSLEQICTASDATRRGIPESSARAQEPSLGSGPSSGPQTGGEQEVLGPKSFSDRTAAGTDDTGRGLPMNVAIGVPFDVESMREYFPTYNDKQWANGKINFTTHCQDQFLKDNWETWFRTALGGRKDGSRTEVRKNFLFFAGLEKHGLRVDWTTVDKSRNIREIPVAERHAARVELWKRRTVFRGSLLYPEEPILRTDEQVPRKPRAKTTSPAGSTPAEDETSPATNKTAKRKLNLDPPRSRSPSPEALERNQPPRNGKKKVEEGAAADMDRKGKTLGKSEHEKRQWGYIDKFINETVQDKIQKRERELKEQIEALEAKNAELQTQLREARDALADAMVGRCELSEPNHAAGPSIDPVEISSDHDDKKGAETHEPTVASTALGLTKRGAKKPRQWSARKPGSHYLSTYWLPRVENIDVGKPGFLVEMEAAKKWILPSPVMDWAEVPYMFIPIHGYLHWSLMIVRIITISPSHRQVRLYHLDSHPGIHLPNRVGTPVRSWLEHTIQDLGEPIKLAKRDVVRHVNMYDCGVHVMALTRSLIQLDDKLGWKLATNEIKDLVKVADVKQLRNEILAKVTGA